MGFVKKAVKGIGHALGGIAKVAMKAMPLIKMIPGVGQIAGAIEFGVNMVKNIKQIAKKGFPKGLVDVAKIAAQSFLPGPVGNIAGALSGNVGAVASLIPAGVKNAIPGANLPIVRGMADLAT